MEKLANAWNNLINTFYGTILMIVVPTAAILAVICLLIMMLNREERTVTAARQWLKRIVLTAVLILVVGFIATTIYNAIAGAGIEGFGTITNPRGGS